MGVPPDGAPLLIVGTGAMACLFAGRLSATGIPVAMLGNWKEGLEALSHSGVQLVDASGTVHCYPVKVVSDPSECPGALYALVLVKSWQTKRAARRLAACLAPDGLALTLQNGLYNCDILANALGPARAVQGATTYGASLVGPGKVRPSGEGVVSLTSHTRLSPLVEILQAAGFTVETISDATSLLWGKLIVNASINPITALLQVPNGELLERPAAHALLQAVAREAEAVAVARGIRLPYPDPVLAAETTARRTAGNLSSMLQDVLRQAPTEIDAINGAIVEQGEQSGIPTPVNRTLWMLIKSLQNQRSE